MRDLPVTGVKQKIELALTVFINKDACPRVQFMQAEHPDAILRQGRPQFSFQQRY